MLTAQAIYLSLFNLHEINLACTELKMSMDEEQTLAVINSASYHEFLSQMI